ncbi:hypothetical protein PAHAL_7G103000 [Panicum hallii]|uniref:Uncharacterized protein n=1 Tax=Panicum hallii TaxID=206008 RepID=A0A2T8IBM1_9POAL|nr:hypothetical protein PAHAL_7G103000 [Panicum hallii]
MENELIRTGMTNMLFCADNKAYRSFQSSLVRCASCQRAQVRYEMAEARATKAEEKHRISRKNFKAYRASLFAGIAQLREQVPRLLSPMA